MAEQKLHVVTGAFGYSGKYITQRLLDKGHRVRTLTNSLQRQNPFGDAVEAHPLNFGDPDTLATSLEGASVLYNTYWVRFNHKTFTHAQAVLNTETLFAAAKQAGVARIVHVSITNPSEMSPLEYFIGKAVIEKALVVSGISHAILRPTVIFGKEDILINNIAWMLRKFPIFCVFGRGDYRLQPIYVDDLAALAVGQGERDKNVVVNAIGPETFTFRELIETLSEIVGVRRPIISIPPSVGHIIGSLIGSFMHDVLITREEIEGLMLGLLYVDAVPAGDTRLTDWAWDHASTLGAYYASELVRRQDRVCGHTSG